MNNRPSFRTFDDFVSFEVTTTVHLSKDLINEIKEKFFPKRERINAIVRIRQEYRGLSLSQLNQISKKLFEAWEAEEAAKLQPNMI